MDSNRLENEFREHSPARAAELDSATLLSIAGSQADAAVMRELRADGYSVTRAHGYIFQRLLTGHQTITELARDLQVTQQGASKHVAELERLGLVARRVSPGDRRARIVALTDRGRAVIVRAREARRAYEDRLRSVLGAARLSSMREALAMVLDDAGISGHIADRSIPWEE